MDLLFFLSLNVVVYSILICTMITCSVQTASYHYLRQALRLPLVHSPTDKSVWKPSVGEENQTNAQLWMTKSKRLGFLSSISSLNRPSGKHRRWGWGPDELGDLRGSIVSVYLYTPAVLQIRDVYPGSYFFPFQIPGQNFFHPGSRIRIKELNLTQKLVSKLSEIWSGLFRIGIRDPNPDFLPNPDPGSRGQKGTGSRIRNTLHRYAQQMSGS
jgi:hypothetical protein